MAPVARRAAAAAVRFVAAAAPSRSAAFRQARTAAATSPRAAAPPRSAAFRQARTAAAIPPRAAASHHASSASTPTPPSAITGNHHASSGVTPTPPSAVTANYNASSAVTLPSAVAGHVSSAFAARPATRIGLASDRLATRFGWPSDRLATRFGRASDRAVAPAGKRFIHLMVASPIPPHLEIELSRLEALEFSRYRDIAEALQQLDIKLSDEQAATLQHMTEGVIYVGTVSWRVCTTVVTVAVGAGFGVLQLAKSGWEKEFDESACSTVTSRLELTKWELEDHMAESIKHRRSVSFAKAFLENEKIKDKALELADKEAALVARETALIARETAVGAK